MEFKRFLAFVVDVFIALFMFVPISTILVLLKIDLSTTILPWLVWGVVFCKDCLGGRSIGKRLLGYQVVNNNSSEIASPYKCILRNLTYLLGVIDIAVMLYKKEGRRIGDYVANTKVVCCGKGRFNF